jgi:SAM-dependent methyltransferase
MDAVGTLRRTARQLLRVDQIRWAIAAARSVWLIRVKHRLRTLSSEDEEGVFDTTVMHNLRSLSDLAVSRSTFLIRPLSVIEGMGPDMLVIGPRTEGEILNLIGHGFDRRHIRAVDLISYSPWIELGNMHELPYPDDSFDSVLMGWVLAYSSDRRRAAAEVVRTCRDGAVVAVGVEYNPLSDEEIVADMGYLSGGGQRMDTVEKILQHFQPHVDHVYFAHEPRAEARDRIGAVGAIFSIRK